MIKVTVVYETLIKILLHELKYKSQFASAFVIQYFN